MSLATPLAAEFLDEKGGRKYCRLHVHERPLIMGVLHQVAVDHVSEQEELIDEIQAAQQEPQTAERDFSSASDNEYTEQFNTLDAIVERRAPKFWGFVKGTSIAPVPDTDEYRVDQLNQAYKAIEGLSESETEWRNIWRKKRTPGAIEASMKKPLVLKRKDEKLEVPAITLFDDSAVNHLLMSRLDFEGDARLAVIKKFEDWRTRYTTEHPDHPIIDERSLEKGYRAFELFLFGAGGPEFLKKLKAVAVDYYYPDSN